MWQVAVGLGLETDRVELSCDVALRSWLVQRGAFDFTQLGGNEERQNTLEGIKGQNLSVPCISVAEVDTVTFKFVPFPFLRSHQAGVCEHV